MLAEGVTEYSYLAGTFRVLSGCGNSRSRLSACCFVLFQTSSKTESLRKDARVLINILDACFAPLAVYDGLCRAVSNCSHGPKINDIECSENRVSNFQSFKSYPRRAARLS